jgi:hypothetical protein
LKGFEKHLDKAMSDDGSKDPNTGKRDPKSGRNWLRDQIRIRKSQIIARYYPKEFPHLVVLTLEEEEEQFPGGLPSWFKRVHFERIAVTEEQITRYELPELPEDQNTLDKLDRDSRTEKFKEKYGKLMAVEVDALDALYPDVLESLVQDSVDEYYEPEIYKNEINDKYGTKRFKREIRLKILQKIRDLEIKLEDELASDDRDDEDEAGTEDQ